MLLLLCALASLSLIFKVVGATEGTHYQVVFLIYSFAFFQLGLPETLVVMLVSNIAQWVWHKDPWYIQILQYRTIFDLSGGDEPGIQHPDDWLCCCGVD